jgi:hypothetical protein
VEKRRLPKIRVPERAPLDDRRETPGRVQAKVGDLIYNSTLRIVSIHKMEILNKEGRAFGYQVVSVEPA